VERGRLHDERALAQGYRRLISPEPDDDVRLSRAGGRRVGDVDPAKMSHS
jgi:hypothetical protein